MNFGIQAQQVYLVPELCSQRHSDCTRAGVIFLTLLCYYLTLSGESLILWCYVGDDDCELTFYELDVRVTVKIDDKPTVRAIMRPCVFLYARSHIQR